MAAGPTSLAPCSRKRSRPRGSSRRAKRAAAEQRVPGKTEVIQFEDEKGQWHEETARGDDRPSTRVIDKG